MSLTSTRHAAWAACAALALAECGSDGNGPPTSGSGTDRAFVAISQHESAIVLARIARQHGQSRFVRRLAAAVTRKESAQIRAMRAEDARLSRAGIDRGELDAGRVTTPIDLDPAVLRNTRRFDRDFIAMLSSNHDGAITLAEAELAQGSSPRVKAIARTIVGSHRREVAAMRRHQVRQAA
jgi:uncharacterized protein (DUF305 family)